MDQQNPDINPLHIIAMYIQCFAVAFAGHTLHEIKWIEVKNRKKIPTLFAVSVIANIISQFGNVILMIHDITVLDEISVVSANFLLALGIMIAMGSFGTMAVIRARALVTTVYKKWLYLFLICPYAYCIVSICSILYLFGIISLDVYYSSIVYGNVISLLNFFSLDMFVLYAILRGNHAVRFSRNKTDRNWICLNIAVAAIFSFASQVYAQYEPILGFPIVFVFWVNILRVFAMYNRFIIASLKGNSVMSNEVSKSITKEPMLLETGTRRASYMPTVSNI